MSTDNLSSLHFQEVCMQSNSIAYFTVFIALQNPDRLIRRKRATSLLSIHRSESVCLKAVPAAVETLTCDEYHRVYGEFTITGSPDCSLEYFSASSLLEAELRFTSSRKSMDLRPMNPYSTGIPSISRTMSPGSSSKFLPPTATRLSEQHLAVRTAGRRDKGSQCATCLKAGKEFPRCRKCGDMWCSRQCRVNGGARHRCKVKSSMLANHHDDATMYCNQ
ncbi:hypothetical protein C8J56DRAFT_915028 [Mycena floridula]|nr:hypothetical protein C8J56DRAFT_915028 [Mycena floridula]